MEENKENGKDIKSNKKNNSGVRGWVKDIAVAVIIAVVVLQFIKPTVVREHSMEPTLHSNDYLFLSKHDRDRKSVV